MKSIIYIMIAATIIVLTPHKQPKTYMVCWEEKDESGGEGRCRHDGILTDSGYLFIDTLYNYNLKKIVVHTTLVSITETK